MVPDADVCLCALGTGDWVEVVTDVLELDPCCSQAVVVGVGADPEVVPPAEVGGLVDGACWLGSRRLRLACSLFPSLGGPLAAFAALV